MLVSGTEEKPPAMIPSTASSDPPSGSCALQFPIFANQKALDSFSAVLGDEQNHSHETKNKYLSSQGCSEAQLGVCL